VVQPLLPAGRAARLSAPGGLPVTPLRPAPARPGDSQSSPLGIGMGRRGRPPASTAQGSSWFPLHICGVKPTVSEELQFNQQVCRGEAKHTLHTCETPRSYCRTSVVPTQSASIRTGVNELMSRAGTAPP
jgi:hypothetical protein